MQFQILDSKRYPLKVTDVLSTDKYIPYYRWEHRATLGYNTRTFLVFTDTVKNLAYIEEEVGGHLEQIKDNSLLTELENFCFSNNFFAILPPILKISKERFI